MQPPDNERTGPSGTGSDISTAIKNETTVPQRIDSFLHDTLLDVFLTAERQWWLRRAQQILQARPRPGDFHGAAGRDELRAQWHRLTDAANACRARAHVSPVEHIREDVENVLREGD